MTREARSALAALVALLAALAIVPTTALAARVPGAASADRTRGGATGARAARRSDAPPETAANLHRQAAAAPRAPASAPLLGAAAPASGGGDEPQAGGSPATETDPLVRNGLGSPLCDRPSSLSAASRRDCESSSFVASAAPTGDFGLDVHIDTGFLGLSSAQLLAIVQNLFVSPVWMALVWAVHALVVMLEWCFALDLLDRGSVRGSVTSSLRSLQDAITVPWLVVVLSVGSVLCAYHGLVRRRVAESLAQALLALAMTAAAIWATVDPGGTVGATARWANDASMGTLAVVVSASPAQPSQALADSFGAVFATAIEVPWCYLEFGDVDWCSSPGRLDPGLHSAALALARSESGEAGCRATSSPSTGCPSGGGAEASALQRSARLLRAASSNGAIFLALPPNGPARNAINDPTSLLRAICRSDDATACKGPAAAEAEFRTDRGTWPRVGGLLLIAAGVLGLLLLLGFIALRLLGAALFSLLYLMLAPVVALAPALGEAGRDAFRKWAAGLFAAVVAKLLFAFLLGAVLAILDLLGHLRPLGWWTRWLLMSAFWWGAFLRRHQILQILGGEPRMASTHARSGPLRRAGDALSAPSAAYERLRAARERFRAKAHELDLPASSTANVPPARPPGSGSAPSRLPTAAARHAEDADSRSPAHDAAGVRVRRSPSADRGSAREGTHREDRGQAERVAAQRDRALAAGSTRRAALLDSRLARLGGEAAGGPGSRLDHSAETRGGGSERAGRYASFLDAQAGLPSADARAAAATPSPQYAALAGLAGYGRREYIQLGTEGKEAARQLIDRELDLRRETPSAALARGSESAPHPQRGGAGPRAGGPLPATARRGPTPARRESARPSESVVMKDALEIMARRRRQLGEGKR